MKTIAILSNEHSWTYNLRREVIEALLVEGYKVVLILPYGEKVDLLVDMGCSYYDVPMFSRRGKNPITELKLILKYRELLKEIKPDIILTYTIKPNLYGGMVAGKLRIPHIANITGLGTAAEKKGVLSFLAKRLYSIGLKHTSCVFAQNKGNKEYLIKNNIIKEERVRLIPGSGVNLQRFMVSEYPDDSVIRFAFVSRVMKEKGIEQYLYAASELKKLYPNTEFHVCGFCEDEYKGDLEQKEKQGIIIYNGMVDDMPEFYKKIHCLVHPSFYLEGLSNVCLEACASGRPIITTDHEGCREIVNDGETGYIVPIKNGSELKAAMEKVIELSNSQKKEMGLKAREYVEAHFDRKIIVDAYLQEVSKF